MKLYKQKSIILSSLILFVTFLIQGPFYKTLRINLSTVTAFGEIILGLIGYLAVLSCVLLVTDKYLNKQNFLKALGAVVVYGIIDTLICKVLSGEPALFYSLIRPMIVVALICFAAKMITKCSIRFDAVLTVLGVVVLIVGIIFNITEHNSASYVDMSNSIFSYVSVMTQKDSISSIMATLCRYVFIFIGVVFAQKCVLDKDSE